MPSGEPLRETGSGFFGNHIYPTITVVGTSFTGFEVALLRGGPGRGTTRDHVRGDG